MKCPKCGHEQAPSVECQRCGVIIAKARKAAARGRPSHRPQPKPSSPQRAENRPVARSQSTPVNHAKTHDAGPSQPKSGPSSRTNSTNVQPKAAGGGSLAWLRGGSLRHRIIFYREMAQLLASAVPLDESLATVERIVRRGRMGTVVADLRASVAAGNTLHEAMARHPGTFDHVELTLVEAASRTGEVAVLFEWLAERLATVGDARSELLSSLVYPALVALSACVLLPAPTFVTEGPSAFVGNVAMNLAVYGGVMFTLLWGLPRVWAHPGARDRLLGIGAAIPLLGGIVRARRFSLVFGTLASGLTAGMPLPDALDLAGRSPGEARVQTAASGAIDALKGGSGFADAVAKLPGIDDETVGLLASGERSGHIDTATQRQAARFEDKYRRGTKVLAQVMKFGISLLVAMVIATAVAGQFAKMLGDPMSMMPAGQRHDLERELNRALPQMRR